MNDSFRFLMSEYGSFANVEPFPPASANELKNVFPAEFLNFLSEAGVGVWQKGRFQFCDPIGMTDIVELIFDGDPDFKTDRTYIYGYGATGRIFVWNADWSETMEVDLPRLEATSLLNRNGKSDAAETIVSSLLYLDGDFYDLLDPATGKAILSKMISKIGALQLGEVFAYVPALELGGSGEPTTLQKVRAFEYFTMLSQLGPTKLYRVQEGGRKFVRNLGKQ